MVEVMFDRFAVGSGGLIFLTVVGLCSVAAVTWLSLKAAKVIKEKRERVWFDRHVELLSRDQ